MKFFKEIIHTKTEDNPIFSQYQKGNISWDYPKYACVYPTPEGIVVFEFLRYYLLGDRPETRDIYVLSMKTYPSILKAVDALDCTVFCDNKMLRKYIENNDVVNLAEVIEDEEQRSIRNKRKEDMLESFEQTVIYIRDDATFPITNDIAYAYFLGSEKRDTDILFDAILQ